MYMCELQLALHSYNWVLYNLGFGRVVWTCLLALSTAYWVHLRKVVPMQAVCGTAMAPV